MHMLKKRFFAILSVVLVFVLCCSAASAATNAEALPVMQIRTPSVSAVNYGDTLILHAERNDAQLPDGCSILWTADGDEMLLEPTFDGMECYVTASGNGKVTIKAIVINAAGEPLTDADGNEIADTQELESRAGIIYKILFLIRRIFLSPKLITE